MSVVVLGRKGEMRLVDVKGKKGSHKFKRLCIYLLGINLHPEGDCPVRPGVFFFPDLGGLLLRCGVFPPGVLLVCIFFGVLLGVLPMPTFGECLYFTANLLDSGVFLSAAMFTWLGVLIRRGELVQGGTMVVERDSLSRVGSLCHLSTGAGGACFRRIRSFS